LHNAESFYAKILNIFIYSLICDQTTLLQLAVVENNETCDFNAGVSNDLPNGPLEGKESDVLVEPPKHPHSKFPEMEEPEADEEESSREEVVGDSIRKRPLQLEENCNDECIEMESAVKASDGDSFIQESTRLNESGSQYASTPDSPTSLCDNENISWCSSPSNCSNVSIGYWPLEKVVGDSPPKSFVEESHGEMDFDLYADLDELPCESLESDRESFMAIYDDLDEVLQEPHPQFLVESDENRSVDLVVDFVKVSTQFYVI